MAEYNYRIADVVGRENLGRAVTEGANEDWETLSICFGGVKQVRNASLNPTAAPVQNVPIFIVLQRKDELTDKDREMFEDGIVEA